MHLHRQSARMFCRIFSRYIIIILSLVLFDSQSVMAKPPRPPLPRIGMKLAQNEVGQPQDRQRARELSQKGSAAFSNKDYDTAQKYFEDAYRSYPANAILYSLGRVFEEKKDWLQTRKIYMQFLAGLKEAEATSQQARDVQSSLRVIESYLGKLKIQTDRPDQHYHIDNGPELTANNESVWLIPGEHLLSAASGEQKLTIVQGETLVFVLNQLLTPVRPPTVTTSSTSAVPVLDATTSTNKLSLRRRVAAGVLGAAAAVVLGGAITLTILDGKAAPGICTFPGAINNTQCVYDNHILYPIAYATAGALAVGMILTLTIPSRPTAKKLSLKPMALSSNM